MPINLSIYLSMYIHICMYVCVCVCVCVCESFYILDTPTYKICERICLHNKC